mmetsp:Transcript_17335/g.22111  ORF Transcript_17335/g.22111 Transcript_17335/m.22111 type:complete len:114 (-) Transcript_17335:1739-2080(-)
MTFSFLVYLNREILIINGLRHRHAPYNSDMLTNKLKNFVVRFFLCSKQDRRNCLHQFICLIYTTSYDESASVAKAAKAKILCSQGHATTTILISTCRGVGSTALKTCLLKSQC